MTGTEFVRTYTGKNAGAWELAAIREAEAGGLVPWPLRAVTFTDGSHTLEVDVATDYLAVGTLDDPLRLPLTSPSAQRIANLFGMLLPTYKMVKTIHEQATTKLEPQGMQLNKGANLLQYAEHNAKIQASRPQGLVSGIKKDVVIGNAFKPGKELIYGWLKPEVPPGKDPSPMMSAPWRVQPYSGVHGEFWVDYSHGIRLVSPNARLDGQDVKLEALMRDPRLASLVSDEGALKMTRYPTPGFPAGAPLLEYIPGVTRIVDLGLRKVQLEES